MIFILKKFKKIYLIKKNKDYIFFYEVNNFFIIYFIIITFKKDN